MLKNGSFAVPYAINQSSQKATVYTQQFVDPYVCQVMNAAAPGTGGANTAALVGGIAGGVGALIVIALIVTIVMIRAKKAKKAAGAGKEGQFMQDVVIRYTEDTKEQGDIGFQKSSTGLNPVKVNARKTPQQQNNTQKRINRK